MRDRLPSIAEPIALDALTVSTAAGSHCAPVPGHRCRPGRDAVAEDVRSFAEVLFDDVIMPSFFEFGGDSNHVDKLVRGRKAGSAVSARQWRPMTGPTWPWKIRDVATADAWRGAVLARARCR